MKITPLFDNVLIKPVAAEQKTAGGIIIPDTAKEKPQIGEVMAVGKGRMDKEGKMIDMVVKIGDKVMYKKWGGTDVKHEGQEWTLVGQDDILAVVA